VWTVIRIEDYEEKITDYWDACDFTGFFASQKLLSV